MTTQDNPQLLAYALSKAAGGRRTTNRFNKEGKIVDLSGRAVTSSADASWSWKELSFLIAFETLSTVQEAVIQNLELFEANDNGQWVPWQGVQTSMTNHPNVVEPIKVSNGLSYIAAYLEKRFEAMKAENPAFDTKAFRQFLAGKGEYYSSQHWNDLAIEIEQAAYAVYGSESQDLWGGRTMTPLGFSKEIIIGRVLRSFEAVLPYLDNRINFWADGDGQSVGKSPPSRLKNLNQLLQVTALRRTSEMVQGAITMGLDVAGALMDLKLRLEATKRGAQYKGMRRQSYVDGAELADALSKAKQCPLNQQLADGHLKFGLTAAFIEPRFNEAVVKQLYEVMHQVAGLENVNLVSDDFEIPRELPVDVHGGVEANWLLQHLWLLAEEIKPRAGGLGSFIISDCEQAEMVKFMRNLLRLFKINDMDVVPLVETNMITTGKEEQLDALIASAEKSVMVALSDLKKRYGQFGAFLELYYLRKIIAAGKVPYLGGDMHGEDFRSLGEWHKRALSKLENPHHAVDMLKLIGLDPVNSDVKMRQTIQGDTSAKIGMTASMFKNHLAPMIPKDWDFTMLNIPGWYKEICFISRLPYLELTNSPSFGELFMYLSKFPPMAVISGRPDQKSGGVDGDNDPKPKTVESARAIIFNQTSLVGGLGAVRLAGIRQIPEEVLAQFQAAYKNGCVFARHMAAYWQRSLLTSAPERLTYLSTIVEESKTSVDRLQAIDSTGRKAYQRVTGQVPPSLPNSILIIEDDLRKLLKNGACSPADATPFNKALIKAVLKIYQTGG